MSLKSLKKQGGFTLLELLIVIVIIGILALLILPNITSAPKKARDTKRKTDLTALQKALEEYYVDNNAYPGSSGAVTTGGTVLAELTVGSAPIMKTLPQDPKNTSPFQYEYTPGNSNTTYTLTACLENDQDQGTDTIAPVSPCTTRTFELVNTN